MNPAYKIPLKQEELALLGELTVILGQVDEILILTVADLLKIDRPAANYIMGSSKVADNAGIWEQVIRNKSADPDILWFVSHAMIEIQKVSADRNDFIHAWFDSGSSYFGPSYFGLGHFGKGYFGGAPTTARRVRNPNKRRPISDLTPIRDQSARLSCLVDYIRHLVNGNPAEGSPLHEILLPTLPPRPQAGATHPQGKGRRQRRRMSRR